MSLQIVPNTSSMFGVLTLHTLRERGMAIGQKLGSLVGEAGRIAPRCQIALDQRPIAASASPPPRARKFTNINLTLIQIAPNRGNMG